MPAPIGDPLPDGDLYVLQGAEDEDQPAVARLLLADGTLARPRFEWMWDDAYTEGNARQWLWAPTRFSRWVTFPRTSSS